MKLISIFFLLFSSMGLCQFSPIWDIPSNFQGFEVRAFDMNESGEMLLIARQYDGGSTNSFMAYSSLDFGQTWDSTYFEDFTVMRDNAVITEGGMMYFASTQNVYPAAGSPYQRKVVHSSLDGGNTWGEKTIDSLSGSNFERAFSFLNDSTGMFFYQSGKYLTQDYGDTWQKISDVGAEHLGVLDDRFIFYWYSSAMAVNPFTNQIDSMHYNPFSVGQVRQSDFHNSTSCRGIRSQDGNLYGPQYNHNFAAVNIDELPLHGQKVTHFPQRYALVDLELTENCIHLVLDGRYTRSCDGGDTFYDVDAFNGNLNEAIFFMDFVNDTLGFVVTVNQITYECTLWKTTNGGGPNLAQVLTNQSLIGVDEIDTETSLSVYPNPASDEITVESDKEIVLLELYSMDGKLVYSEEPKSKMTKLNLSAIASGNYLLKCESSSDSTISKIVVE